MHLFRRQIFRTLARLMVVSVMLGNAAAVWAAVDSALSTNDMVSSNCQMQQQSDDQQNGNGNCCQESGDCVEHCDTCVGTFTSSANYFSHTMISVLPSNTKFLPNTTTLSDGVNIGQLHRPPIFSA